MRQKFTAVYKPSTTFGNKSRVNPAPLLSTEVVLDKPSTTFGTKVVLGEKSKLPKYFKPLFWSYDFSSIDPVKHKKTIIVNSLNYGHWQYWQWIIKKYGKKQIKQFLINTPMSEFRQRSLTLISILLDIKKFKYASRNDYIKAKKDI